MDCPRTILFGYARSDQDFAQPRYHGQRAVSIPLDYRARHAGGKWRGEIDNPWERGCILHDFDFVCVRKTINNSYQIKLVFKKGRIMV